MWHYLTTEDMQFFKGKVSDETLLEVISSM